MTIDHRVVNALRVAALRAARKHLDAHTRQHFAGGGGPAAGTPAGAGSPATAASTPTGSYGPSIADFDAAYIQGSGQVPLTNAQVLSVLNDIGDPLINQALAHTPSAVGDPHAASVHVNSPAALTGLTDQQQQAIATLEADQNQAFQNQEQNGSNPSQVLRSWLNPSFNPDGGGPNGSPNSGPNSGPDTGQNTGPNTGQNNGPNTGTPNTGTTTGPASVGNTGVPAAQDTATAITEGVTNPANNITDPASTVAAQNTATAITEGTISGIGISPQGFNAYISDQGLLTDAQMANMQAAQEAFLADALSIGISPEDAIAAQNDALGPDGFGPTDNGGNPNGDNGGPSPSGDGDYADGGEIPHDDSSVDHALKVIAARLHRDRRSGSRDSFARGGFAGGGGPGGGASDDNATPTSSQSTSGADSSGNNGGGSGSGPVGNAAQGLNLVAPPLFSSGSSLAQRLLDSGVLSLGQISELQHGNKLTGAIHPALGPEAGQSINEGGIAPTVSDPAHGLVPLNPSLLNQFDNAFGLTHNFPVQDSPYWKPFYEGAYANLGLPNYYDPQLDSVYANASTLGAISSLSPNSYDSLNNPFGPYTDSSSLALSFMSPEATQSAYVQPSTFADIYGQPMVSVPYNGGSPEEVNALIKSPQQDEFDESAAAKAVWNGWDPAITGLPGPTAPASWWPDGGRLLPDGRTMLPNGIILGDPSKLGGIDFLGWGANPDGTTYSEDITLPEEE